VIGLSALLVFLTVALVGYAAAGAVDRRETARRTIRERLDSMAGRGGGEASILKDHRYSRIALLDALLGRLTLTAPLVRMIRQAGLSNRVGEVVLYIPLVACSALLLVMLLTENRALAVVAGIVGGAVPIFVLQRKRSRRMRLFSEQLPDALDLVRAALQAGHSVGTALYVVADEFPNPLAEEFRIVAEEMRLGLPLRDALYGLRDRVDDVNVPILIVGVLVAHEVGGNLAEVLDNVSYTIRERFKLLRDVQVMTAQGRFSGRVLTALPFMGGLFMYFFNPVYFAPMLDDPRGKYLIAYALVSILLGHLIIQRIVRIRV
jgi:tight adherence protein B